MDVDLRLALQQHQRGCLEEAGRLYQNILASRPDNSEALHLLGVVAHQQRRHEPAIQLIERAIALNPGRAAYHANLAEANRAAGKFDRAAS